MTAWWWCIDPQSQAPSFEFRSKVFGDVSTGMVLWGPQKAFCPFLYSQKSRGPSLSLSLPLKHTHTHHHQFWNQAGPSGVSGQKNLFGKEGAFTPQDLLWFPRSWFKWSLIREGRGWRDKGGAVKKQSCNLEATSWFHFKRSALQ